MKHSLLKLVTVIFIISIFSCTKEPLKAPQAISILTENNATKKAARHYIGERFGGGIIYALNSAKTHGLIADTVDLPQAAWWNGTYTITGATGTAIGTGKSNTKKIVSSQGPTGNYAAIVCVQSNRSGYTDWFLPSINELKLLYTQSANSVVGGFNNNNYWSSTETANLAADSWDFGRGIQSNDNKFNVFNVRAIRIF